MYSAVRVLLRVELGVCSACALRCGWCALYLIGWKISRMFLVSLSFLSLASSHSLEVTFLLAPQLHQTSSQHTATQTATHTAACGSSLHHFSRKTANSHCQQTTHQYCFHPFCGHTNGDFLTALQPARFPCVLPLNTHTHRSTN